jgi:hypothetical protein
MPVVPRLVKEAARMFLIPADAEWPVPRRVYSLALAGLMGIFAGCGPGGPKTYPVKGKVVTPNAEALKRLVGQAVELQSTTEPNTRGFGQIQADGSFTISTYRLGVALSGAIEGTHRARIAPTASDDDDGRGRLRAFDRKYTRFDSSGWEFVVPTAGDVILKLP